VAHYLVQLAYTPEAWAAQLKNPQNRNEVVRPALEKVGARFEAVYYAFGKCDVVAIVEASDNVSAAALSLAISASGALKAYETTPLMSIEEGIEAMRKGGEVAAAYRPPTR
jgi:uncharacterized protein with GYD domain